MKYRSVFKPFSSLQNNARKKEGGEQVLWVLYPEVGHAIQLRTEGKKKKTVLMYAQKIVNM